MRLQTIQLHCDMCGYGGPYSEPEDFVAIGDVDLCRWCALPAPRLWVETGGHRVTFDGESWLCSCGGSHEETLIRLRYAKEPVTARVMNSVPRLANATAHVHLERS